MSKTKSRKTGCGGEVRRAVVGGASLGGKGRRASLGSLRKERRPWASVLFFFFERQSQRERQREVSICWFESHCSTSDPALWDGLGKQWVVPLSTAEWQAVSERREEEEHFQGQVTWKMTGALASVWQHKPLPPTLPHPPPPLSFLPSDLSVNLP